MTLRKKLNEYLAKTMLLPSTKHDFTIYVSKSDWIHAKYLCTSEEKEFTFNKGTVMYNGFELKTI